MDRCVIEPLHILDKAVISGTATTQASTRRCLIVEDDAHNAGYIAVGLRQLGYTTSVCSNGTEGLHRATGEAWDVIILDRLLPENIDGLSILTALRALEISTPVLILSALSALDERVRGLRSGCDDYLAKPFAFVELAARVDALIRRSRQGVDTHELRLADLKVDLIARRVERAGRAISLQPREFRLLVYLLKHQGQVVTRTMLLESVWDYHFDPSTNIIDVHISRLRNKIEKDLPTPLIHTVRGIGYMMTAEDVSPG